MFKRGKYILLVTLCSYFCLSFLPVSASVVDNGERIDTQHQDIQENIHMNESNNWWNTIYQYWKQYEENSKYENDSNHMEEKLESEDSKITNDEIDSLHTFETEVIELTNKEREKHGLRPFSHDRALSKVAKEKSVDMRKNNYFDHNSPVYGSPFDMMKSFGITYQAAGENIAMGQQTPDEVVKAWMNSPGHRANILNEQFTHIGVGFDENGNYWTQQFIGK